jgi:hypothetical protein
MDVSPSLMAIMGAVVAIALLGLWSNRSAKRHRARSTAEDVVASIEVLWDDGSMDAWELFLKYALDDPYLESVRQRCRTIYEKHDAQPSQYMTDDGIRLVAEILDELKQHIERKRTASGRVSD